MSVRSGVDGRRALWRSRWAAIGAAVAVTLGGGGIFVAGAASSPASSVVTIDPVRVLDTRSNVGLAGPFVSAVSRKLQVTGPVLTTTGTQTPVPAGATGVLFNVTVVAPTAAGFLSVRPGDATGVPSTSSLNFTGGDIVANAVQVGLPTSGANAGKVDITFDAYGVAGPTAAVLVDVVGYMVAGGGGATGPAGPAGPKGDTGEAGAAGNAVAVTFQSTVTGAINSVPAGVAQNDTVRFAADLPDATGSNAESRFECIPGPGLQIDTHAVEWSFAPVPYVLTYSSGYKQFGQIDAVLICDGGLLDDGGGSHPWRDSIVFFDGDNEIWEVIDFEGSWYAGPIPDDLTTAMLDIAQPGLFDLTMYWGSYGAWATYNYDYATPQVNTIVTRSP